MKHEKKGSHSHMKEGGMKYHPEHKVEHAKGGKYSDSSLKPDKTNHKAKQDMGTEAKKSTLPGQMYVPKVCHNESDFTGEER